MPRKENRGKKPLELAGVKFGQLTALERNGYKGKRITWLCVCDCGRKKTLTVDDLRSGHAKSCGCLRDDVETIDKRNGIHSTSESCAYILFKSYKHNAKNRNHPFALSFEQFKELTKADCHYCGGPPENVTPKTKDGDPYIFNGIDRKDNSIGYILDNCLPCCGFCNVAKHSKSYEDFTAWLERAGKYQMSMECQQRRIISASANR